MTSGIQFSICIPVYNREGLIARALESCLKQSGRDFEVVVVDDGSSDQTVAAIEALRDERIHLLAQDSNRGHSTARNIALDAAKGEWVVILDSDDELLPGGLDRIRKVVESGGTDVDCYEFMYARDDGGHSPDPPMIDRRIDFKDYLRSWNHRRFFDALRCIRRSAALQTPWREWQTAGALFNSLELHHMHRCAEVSASVALIHTDATNRISWIRRDAAMASRAGHDLGEEMDLIFERYENELRRWAPLTWKRFQRVRASYFFLAGCRRSGVRQTMRCLARSPLAAEMWAQLIFGLTGPSLYSRIRSRRRPPT